MQDGIQSYEGFLSTLAGVTGTLVALLLGFGGAYYVFLRERAAQFEDQIEQRKLEIRDTLSHLRKEWVAPTPTMYAYLPPDFDRLVRENYPGLSEPDLLERIALDLLREAPELQRVVDASGAIAPGSWKGRLYYWLLGQGVDVLTVTSSGRTHPRGVFPHDPSGPGFDEWRQMYARFRKSAFVFAFNRKALEDDFSSFISSQPGAPPVLNDVVKRSIALFFSTLDDLNRQLDLIEKDELLRRRYSPTPLHPTSLLFLVCLSSVLGLALPLGLLAAPGVRLTPTAIATLLIVTLVSLSMAYIQLWRDVARGPGEERSAYIRVRWYRVLQEELTRNEAMLDRIGILDTALFENALRSNDRSLFPGDLLDAIRSIVERATHLQKVTNRLNSCVMDEMRADPSISGRMEPYDGKGGVSLAGPTLTDEAMFAAWLQNYARVSLTTIMVERLGPGWSTTEAAIPIPGTEEERQKLAETLKRFQARLSATGEVADFRMAKAETRKAIGHLRNQLDLAASHQGDATD